MSNLSLSLLPETLAVCRLPPDSAVPQWAFTGSFVSVTRTTDELSIVCAQAAVPQGIQHVANWRALKLHGPFDLTTETGILVQILAPLGEAAIPIFAISTYDTDYILIAADNLEAAIAVLRRAGHTIID